MSELSQLKDKLSRAETGYSDSIAAIKYMPFESKPHTRQTAINYMEEIERLKLLIFEHTGQKQ